MKNKIVTVTLNPALDKTTEIEALIHGGLNRLSGVITDPGGKGINVSKTISALGGSSVATGFLAGNNGHILEEMLHEQGIVTDFLWTAGETRTNLKVMEQNGLLTEFNEAGPKIAEEDIMKLQDKLLSLADEHTYFVISGSIPKGVSTSVYAKIIERLKQKNAHVFLDADGEAFAAAVERKPDLIKPNQFELSQYFKTAENLSESEIVGLVKKLQEKGIKHVVVSMGREGALFAIGDAVIRVPGLEVEQHSLVGAGDAMLGALTYGFSNEWELEAIIKLCVAVSAGAVMTAGTKPPKKDIIDRLMQKVTLIYQ